MFKNVLQKKWITRPFRRRQIIRSRGHFKKKIMGLPFAARASGKTVS